MLNRFTGAMLTPGHTHQFVKALAAVLFTRRIPPWRTLSHNHVQSGSAGGVAGFRLARSVYGCQILRLACPAQRVVLPGARP